MSIFPPGDPRNDNSPSGIRWESNPADAAEIERLKLELTRAKADADLNYKHSQVWRKRCKEAQRHLTALINLCDYEEAIVPDDAKVARDAGKDE